MNDGHNETGTGERKLIWDEENRLLAVDDNGFVSNYWYDADGERTVKTSGESDQVYVNGVFSGGSTNTAKFSLYVSPYLVANQSGRYTKHIYAGSQRIVSKIGDFASYGSDPRRIEYAGANTDGLSVDYKAKYAAQQQVIRDNYKFFDVPYNGTDNDNYADGEGFCCNDGSMEAAVAQARKAQVRAVAKSFKDPDNYESLQFFYHPDHLGSSSFITNLEGEVVQHIEYVPFGEVFIEERNSVWNTPYLFNAKEFDEETGMYYYGARYYEPRLSLWMSTDPLGEKNPHLSPYNFVSNNPLNRIDPWGLTDYEVDGETRTIQDGHNNLRMTVGNADFAKLQKAFGESMNSYESLMNNLSVKNGYTTSGIYRDNESSIGYGILITAHRPGGQSYSEWSIDSRSTYSPYFNVLEGAGAIADASIGQLNKINVGNNGKWYFKQKSGRIFNGNQYVTTIPAKIKYASFIKGANRVGGVVTIASSGYDIYQGYVQDGGRYGYNAQVQTAGAIGGFAGGVAGAKLGAAIGAGIGAWFGGVGSVPGGIIGGFIGGAFGAFGGDYYGEKAAKSILK